MVELLARTRGVMRRIRLENLVSSQSFISKDLSVDFDSRQVIVQGESVQLTPTEFKFVSYLVRNPHKALTTEEILEQVWGGEYRSSGGLLKAHIQRLRKKLKDDKQNPRLIYTERGRGYRFIGKI